MSSENKLFGGEGGIRTHGTFRFAGFQDQYLQPLGHLTKVGAKHNQCAMSEKGGESEILIGILG